MIFTLKNRISLTLVTLVTLLFAVQAHAAINEQLTFYGTLQDSVGTDLAGTYDMVFNFYDAPTGGTLLDTSTHTAGNGNPVTVTTGEFAVELGSGAGNALDGIDFNASPIYVGLSVEGDGEIALRVPLTAAAYAFNADTLDGFHADVFLGLNGTSSLSVTSTDTALTVIQNSTGALLDLFDGSTNVLTVTGGGLVGIGTTTPTSDLTVDGDVEITGDLYDTTGDTTASGIITSTVLGTDWVATSSFGGGGGSSLFTDGGTTTYLTATTSYLALGTTTATGKLTIANGNLDIIGNGSLLLSSAPAMYGSSTTNVLAIGRNAGSVNGNIGTDSIFIGSNSGSQISANAISFNTIIGHNAAMNASSTSYSTIIGYSAGQYSMGDHNFLTGFYSGRYFTGSHNVGIGRDTFILAKASHSVGIGSYAFEYSPYGNKNVAFGVSPSANTTGSNNVAIGWNANSQGFYGFNDESIFLGEQSGNFATGKNNIFVGYYAGHESGGFGGVGQNIAIGYNSFAQGESGENSVILGYFTSYYSESVDSVVLGAQAMQESTEEYKYRNVVLGADNLQASDEFSNDNILLGYRALFSTSDIARRMIMVGDNITEWNGFGSDEADAMSIGNLVYGTGMTASGTAISSGNVGIGINVPTAQLHTTGSLRFSTFGVGNLTTDAAGNVSASSDEQLKSVLSIYSGGISSLLNLEPIVYQWNETSGFETIEEYIGFSAQNVQASIPGAVGVDPRGFLTLSDRGILATVVNAVKEVWIRLTEQAVELASLDEDIEVLVAASESISQDLELVVASFDLPTKETSPVSASSTTTPTTTPPVLPISTSTSTTTP